MPPLFESCFSELRVNGRRLYLKGVNWFGFEVSVLCRCVSKSDV
jgi:beta-galactosidase/beta-glucuronidase